MLVISCLRFEVGSRVKRVVNVVDVLVRILVRNDMYIHISVKILITSLNQRNLFNISYHSINIVTNLNFK